MYICSFVELFFTPGAKSVPNPGGIPLGEPNSRKRRKEIKIEAKASAQVSGIRVWLGGQWQDAKAGRFPWKRLVIWNQCLGTGTGVTVGGRVIDFKPIATHDLEVRDLTPTHDTFLILVSDLGETPIPCLPTKTAITTANGPAIQLTYSTIWGGVMLIGRKVEIQKTEHPLDAWKRERKMAARKRAMIRKIEAVTAEELLPRLNAERQKAGGYKARQELAKVIRYTMGAMASSYNEAIEKQVTKLQPKVVELLKKQVEAERAKARADRIELVRSREVQLRTALTEFAEHPYRMADIEMIQIIEDMLETGRPPRWLKDVYGTRSRDISAALRSALK